MNLLLNFLNKDKSYKNLTLKILLEMVFLLIFYLCLCPRCFDYIIIIFYAKQRIFICMYDCIYECI